MTICGDVVETGEQILSPRLLFSRESWLLLRRRKRADLAVRAVAANLVAWRGFKAPRPDARRGGLDRRYGLLKVFLRGGVAARQARLQEAQLHAGREFAGHFLLGQRVDLELERFSGALVGRLLLRDVARLVVDDDKSLRGVIEAVEAAADAIVRQAEAELFLDLHR